MNADSGLKFDIGPPEKSRPKLANAARWKMLSVTEAGRLEPLSVEKTTSQKFFFSVAGKSAYNYFAQNADLHN